MSNEQRVFLHVFPTVDLEDLAPITNRQVSFKPELRRTIHPSRQGAEIAARDTGGMIVEVPTSALRSLMELKTGEEAEIYLTDIESNRNPRHGWDGSIDFSLVLDDSTPFKYQKGGNKLVMTTPESKAWVKTFEKQVGGYLYL